MRGIQVTTCRICRKCGTLTHNKCCLCDDCYDKFKTGWAVSQNGKSASQRGYGYLWRKIRERVIKRAKGLCEECLRLGFVTAGCDVDHIKSKAKGGTDDLENLQLLGGTDDLENLQLLCKECHKKKTQEEK